ncbi:MAG: Ppx/GppA family phosphatase [Bacteroidota bacterium]|nr:Ppx/GppA family phosphatase [Bacteroidota bacterium]
MSRLAIVDLGTNTFNLLIVEIGADWSYTILFQTKISVKLGEGGINKGFITDTAFSRGIEALKTHSETIRKYSVEKIMAFATSAIRDASNGSEFVTKAKTETGIDVQVISGEREAELIYFGVREAAKMTEATSLIIDIGGGSTEFIIANKNQVFWKYSFALGAARLLERFDPSDPITVEQTGAVDDYLEKELRPLYDAVKKYPVTELIGSSGSFDSLAEMIAHKFYTPDILSDNTEYSFHMPDCAEMYALLIRSTKEDRLKMKGLVAMRVDMIVISSILVHFIITRFDIHKMRLSTYSLKEGVLYDLISATRKNGTA